MKFQKSILPCSTCPWRVEQDASVIPQFRVEKARDLIKACGDEDALRPIMACHGSTECTTVICAGYLAKEGWHNISVRMLFLSGRCETPDKVADACHDAGIELHNNYLEVLAKLEATR
jgi:hypothetical protein